MDVVDLNSHFEALPSWLETGEIRRTSKTKTCPQALKRFDEMKLHLNRRPRLFKLAIAEGTDNWV
jgi:hypothetical protein